MISFITESIPRLDFVSKLTLTVDEEQFLESCSRIMKLTPEGVVVTASVDQLTDRELILLHLSRVHFGYITKKLESERALIGELIAYTKKPAGTIAGRISEMSAEGLVERVGKGEYRITTYGLDSFIKNVLPKLST